MATITSVVRGGGLGSRAWVARITGPDAKYGLARQFVRKQADLSGSGRSGSIHFELPGAGYYEVRGLMTHEWSIASGERSGFVRVDADGTVTWVDRSEVVAAVTAPAPSTRRAFRCPRCGDTRDTTISGYCDDCDA